MEPSTAPVGAAPARRGIRVATARWIAESHPAGLMLGAVLVAAVLAVVDDEDASEAVVVASTAGVLVVYWFTHSYVDALARGISGDGHHLMHRLLRAAGREVALLLGGAPALVTFGLALSLGVGFSHAVEAALWLTLVILTVAGYLAGHLAGISGWRLAAETAFAALVGVFMVLLRTLLH